jgi:hypothetical protein
VALVCGDAAQATNYLLRVKLRNGSALTRGLFGHCRSKVSRAAALHRTSKMLPMSFRGSDCFPSAARAVRNRALIAAGHLWFAVCDVWETATRNQRRLLRTPVDGTTCREGCGAVLCGVCPGAKHRVPLRFGFCIEIGYKLPAGVRRGLRQVNLRDVHSYDFFSGLTNNADARLALSSGCLRR